MPQMSALGSPYIIDRHTEEGVFVEAAKREIHSIPLAQDTDEKTVALSFQHDTCLAFPKSNDHLSTLFFLQHLPLPKSQSSHEQLKPYCYIQKHRACFRHREAVSLKCLRRRKEVNLDFSYLQQQRAKERQSTNTISFSSNL